MKSVQLKITCFVLTAFFVQAMLLGSVCVSTRGVSGARDKVLLSLDVCGHGSPAGVSAGTDFVAAISFVPQICIIEPTGFPPPPGESVASAGPGETGKPPELSLS